MVKGKTSSGFEFEVNEKVTKSWEFTKTVKLVKSRDDADQVSGVVDIVHMLLGNQEDALMDHLRDSDGYAMTADIVAEISEILAIIQKEDPETKK